MQQVFPDEQAFGMSRVQNKVPIGPVALHTAYHIVNLRSV